MFAVFSNEVLLGESRDPNRMHMYRSAILQVQEADGDLLDQDRNLWAGLDAAISISNSYMNQKAEMRQEELRMAFTREMLDEASQVLKGESKGAGLIEVGKVTIGGQLRRQEFIDLRVKDFNADDSTLWVLNSKRKSVEYMTDEGLLEGRHQADRMPRSTGNPQTTTDQAFRNGGTLEAAFSCRDAQHRSAHQSTEGVCRGAESVEEQIESSEVFPKIRV